jgi:hypothetical protein
MSLQLFHPPNLVSENWSGSIDLRIIYFTFKMWVKSIDNIHFILFKAGCKESRLFDHVRVSNHKLKRKKVQKEFVQVKDNDLHCMQYITQYLNVSQVSSSCSFSSPPLFFNMFVLGFWLVDLHMGGVLTFVVFSCPLKTTFFLTHVSYTILNFFAFNKCEVFRPFRLFVKSCETFLLK